MNRSLSHIDLNCDVGEAATPEQLDVERHMIDHVTSVNIACGLHAGSPDLMRDTLRFAAQRGRAVGAHPGFPDRGSFGRSEHHWPASSIETIVVYQIGALRAIAKLEGITLSHVKLHGALYNMAARDPEWARAVARAVAAVDRSLILVGLAGSQLLDAGKELGLRVAAEAFVDRAYHQDGRLVSRNEPNAILTEEQAVLSRLQDLVHHGRVWSVEGPACDLKSETICLHADTPGAVHLARAIWAALTAAGISLRRLDRADV
jgi:UPF0271 protein